MSPYLYAMHTFSVRAHLALPVHTCMTCNVQMHNSSCCSLGSYWQALHGGCQQRMHDVPDGDEVLQRLGHLEAFYGEVASV